MHALKPFTCKYKRRGRGILIKKILPKAQRIQDIETDANSVFIFLIIIVISQNCQSGQVCGLLKMVRVVMEVNCVKV